MRSVHQFLKPKDADRQVRENGSNWAVVADLIGSSQTALSLWTGGDRALSLKLQQKIMAVLAFFEELQEGREIPLDLSDASALRPRWEKFQRIRLDSEVLRDAEEGEEAE